LREGSAVADSLYPDRIVVGGDSSTLSVLRELYEPLVAQAFTPPPGVPRPSSMISVPLLATSLTSAEMIKYAANAFLAMKISFANDIASTGGVSAPRPQEVMAVSVPGPAWCAGSLARASAGRKLFRQGHSSLLHRAEYGYSSKLPANALDVKPPAPGGGQAWKLCILKGFFHRVAWLALGTDELARCAGPGHIAERLIQMGARVRPAGSITRAACASGAISNALLRQREGTLQRCRTSAGTEWREFYDLAAELAAMVNPI
jgi:UDPglucose 6-dehydrogenase